MKAKYPKTLFHIVLIEPEIPNNTGNIGRLCVGAWCQLHLVGPMGFEINDTRVKRAGLDYWPHLTWQHHKTWEDWQRLISDRERVFYFSKKANHTLFEMELRSGDWLVFGKETVGLPEEFVKANMKSCYRIPMLGSIRSYNLANSVSMVVGEGLRQMSLQGEVILS